MRSCQVTRKSNDLVRNLELVDAIEEPQLTGFKLFKDRDGSLVYYADHDLLSISSQQSL